MERDVQLPVGWTSGGYRRRDRTDQNEPRLLPHELRHRRASDPFPEPSLAPYLAHRLHRHAGDLAVPILPPRRAAGDFQPRDRRPRGPDPALGPHDRFPLVDSRDGQHPSLAVDWSCACVDTRRFQEDR
ncbi:hypothetical protein U1Q18_026901 [Sarracenia purpurea var. burkii]